MDKNTKTYLRKRTEFFCAVFILFFFLGMCAKTDAAVAVFAALNVVSGVICVLCGRTGKTLLKTVGVAAIISALGLLWASASKYVYYYPSQRFLEKYEGRECGLVLRVDKTENEGDSYGNYNCSIIMCNGEYTEKTFGIRPSIRLTCFGGDFAGKGDMVYLEGKIQRPDKISSSGFMEESYLKSRHIFMNCEHNGELLLLRKGGDSFTDRVRGRLSANISKYVGNAGSDTAAVAKCMLLGDKSGISSELKNIFRKAGISHVLSVSGLHLSILFMTVSVFFGLRRRSPRRRFVYAETISCIFILLYMALAAFTPSIMRAGFMLIFMNLYSARLYYKQKFNKADIGKSKNESGGYSSGEDITYDSVSSLFCAGALIILLSPYSIFDVGMQLSFMSTLGILVAVYIFGRYTDAVKNKYLRAIAVSLLITYSAVSFTLPICIYNFGALPTLGAVANLAVTPLMTPLLAILLVLALLSLIPSVAVIAAICSLLGKIAQVLCGIVIWCAGVISRIPFASVTATDNKVTVTVFVILVSAVVTCLFFGQRSKCKIPYLMLVMLYFVCLNVSFLFTFADYVKTKISLCTVYDYPYFCVSSWDDRIVFHDCSGVASDSITEKVLGDEMYGTDIYYLVVPCKSADIESAYFNITCLDRNRDIKKVLLPSYDISSAFGFDMKEYADVIRRLSECGIDYAFYGDEFTLCGKSFRVRENADGIGFVFEDTSVVFADTYDEKFANDISDGREYCIYFCNRAAITENKGYTSDAKLYISSAVHKNVAGAENIPTRKPARLK